jgi:hypothetical protein
VIDLSTQVRRLGVSAEPMLSVLSHMLRLAIGNRVDSIVQQVGVGDTVCGGVVLLRTFRGSRIQGWEYKKTAIVWLAARCHSWQR